MENPPNSIETRQRRILQVLVQNALQRGCWFHISNDRHGLPIRDEFQLSPPAIRLNLTRFTRDGLIGNKIFNPEHYSHDAQVEFAVCLAISAINPLETLVVCAHEYGHFQDLQAGRLSEGFKPEVRKELEISAWDNAEQVLSQLGFDDWTAFKQFRDESLSSYGIDEAPTIT